jgi:2'-5' RNA ligase
MKRTFIAFDITPSNETKAAYELIRFKLRLEKINWIPDSNFHITLKFLGDTEKELIPDIIRKIDTIVTNHRPVNLGLHGIGVFKNLHDPRVLWMGCNFERNLVILAKEMDEGMKAFGYAPENRDFAPHLTLGRIKQIRQINQLSEIIAMYKETEFQRQKIEDIIFYESLLSSSGSTYIPIEKFRLV